MTSVVVTHNLPPGMCIRCRVNERDHGVICRACLRTICCDRRSARHQLCGHDIADEVVPALVAAK